MQDPRRFPGKRVCRVAQIVKRDAALTNIKLFRVSNWRHLTSDLWTRRFIVAGVPLEGSGEPRSHTHTHTHTLPSWTTSSAIRVAMRGETTPTSGGQKSGLNEQCTCNAIRNDNLIWSGLLCETYIKLDVSSRWARFPSQKDRLCIFGCVCGWCGSGWCASQVRTEAFWCTPSYCFWFE